MNIKLVAVNEELASAIDPQNIKWPEGSVVIYAIDQDTNKIVGRTALVQMPLIEGTQIFEEDAKGKLLKKLIDTLEESVMGIGHGSLFAMALDKTPKVKDYLERLGYEKFPASIYVKDLRKPEEKEGT